jgi:hypothetical protein
MSGADTPHGDSTVAAVLRLTGLAAQVEGLGRDCAAAVEQIAGLREEFGTLGGRADGIERRLDEVNALLGRMAEQITALAPADNPPPEAGPVYQVNPAPPWWKPADPACADTRARLGDWVAEVYRPVFGYLADLLAPCWQQHPLCLAYLDVLHEAWCLLYLLPRDPKMVFAQLDWLTRPLLQAAEVLAAETRACRDRGSHRDPAKPDTPSLAFSLNGHR